MILKKGITNRTALFKNCQKFAERYHLLSVTGTVLPASLSRQKHCFRILDPYPFRKDSRTRLEKTTLTFHCTCFISLSKYREYRKRQWKWGNKPKVKRTLEYILHFISLFFHFHCLYEAQFGSVISVLYRFCAQKEIEIFPVPPDTRYRE